MTKDAEHWLALHHAPGLPAGGARALVEHFGGARAACTAAASELRGLNVSAEAARFLRTPGGEGFECDLRWTERDDSVLLGWGDTGYPHRLREIDSPPLLLFVIGDAALLDEPQIVIVGSRRPTPGGLATARRFAGSLASSGLIITSGLATGIDAAAHEAALDTPAPTIAVIGTGPDIVYPAKHRELTHRIAEHGAVVSEFSCTTPPRASNFPRRNRLLSGLSYGVVVVEAAERSGTLITARLAGEQGREVFAVPGAIINPVARGCHRLIQQGAKLAQSPEDVLIELASLVDLKLQTGTDAPTGEGKAKGRAKAKVATAAGAAPDPEHRRLLECMGYDEPLSVDALVERSGLTAAEVSSMLLIMELEGHVSCVNHLYTRTQ